MPLYTVIFPVAALFFTLILSACGASSVNQHHSAITIPSNATLLESNGKNYSIFFTPSKEKIPFNRYFDMQVQIRNSMQQLIVFPLTLQVDASMKAHRHGMNVQPTIEALGHGKYKIKGMLLHMPGEWQLEFTIHRGVLTDSATTTLVIQ